ncbi:hypothetical protein ZWY2020_046850 [Hordeum vulgare]|nr:hypothetical protein ZWY2020_046850 [Hordeum vulgare]
MHARSIHMTRQRSYIVCVPRADMMEVFSGCRATSTLLDHTSDIGWKAFARAMPVIIDAALYAKKGDLFWIPQKRELPTALKLFTVPLQDDPVLDRIDASLLSRPSMLAPGAGAPIASRPQRHDPYLLL